MNKTKFRLLVFFMSLSLIGIILVQLYWVNSSLKNSDEQFRFNVYQTLGKISENLDKKVGFKFLEVYDHYKDSVGHPPTRKEMYSYYGYNSERNKDENIIYSDNITVGDYRDLFFDKKDVETLARSKAKVNDGDITNSSKKYRDMDYEQRMRLYNFELYLKDFREFNSLDSWLSKEKLKKMLEAELGQKNIVDTDFEFAIYNNGLPTKIRSDNFTYDKSNFYERQIFEGNSGTNGYRLLLSFPKKETFLFSSILGITSLSLIFTLIIIIAYLSAINQLIKQKQISEIKTDFINNMTHEFKTPIATINLALDAIRSPKIFDDKEKVMRYLQMIRDENKRMHAQVENVLQISKLDKRELEITKDHADIHDILEGAIEHVYLMIEARHGTLTRHFNAQRTTALLNDVHFTNVLVNILDNAIKYSSDEPVIDIYTENVKDFILIKIKDNGVGISKVTQKRIFEKFYREHTGDIHNVKGHGLGLAYVKRIIDDHNCHIYVESEKGKGSTFIIKMPLIN
ncbi:Sensor protein kinase WalK [compost metagenome]